jgi:transposase
MDDRTEELVKELRRENKLLRAEIKRLNEQIENLEKQNRQLHQQLEKAQQQVARQAAPFRREQREKIPPDKHKPPGQKPGHPGCCRKEPDHIDQTIELPLDNCPSCSGPLKDIKRIEQVIEEIPPVRPRVVKVITYCGWCPCCGAVGTYHPLQTSYGQGAAKVQLGPRALSLAASLNKVHGLTMRKTCQVLEHLCGLRITAGGLSQALSRIAGRVQWVYQKLIDDIRASPAVFADETSWWVSGPGWLWVFTTPTGTVYHVDQRRGSEVVSKILGDHFAGMLVSDCLSSYDPADCAKHKCIAHHLRAISKAMKLPCSDDHEYLLTWRSFFHGVIALYRLRESLSKAEFIDKRKAMENWRDELLGKTVSQPGDVAVRNRLLKQRKHLLGCLYEPAAEPTNNRAERALRPAVIARKVSCGNKTERGRDCWQTLSSIGASCQQQTLDFVEFLSSHLSLSAAAG